jgi:hypothetical protein
MKIDVEEKAEVFNPIKIVLTIESKEELISLWKRIAVESYDVDYLVKKRYLDIDLHDPVRDAVSAKCIEIPELQKKLSNIIIGE